MARLYADENFPQQVVVALRALGHDVLSVVETGRAEQSWPDEEVLEYARLQGRCLLTLNRRHFIRLHNDGLEHAGIICCTYDSDFAGQAARIDVSIRECGVLRRALLRVNRPR